MLISLRRIPSRRTTLVLLFASLSAWGDPPDWENPRLTGLNCEPPHANMVICPDAKTALSVGAI